MKKLTIALDDVVAERERAEKAEAERDELRTAYESWKLEGQRLHGALLDIWRMLGDDRKHLTFGDGERASEVVAEVERLRGELATYDADLATIEARDEWRAKYDALAAGVAEYLDRAPRPLTAAGSEWNDWLRNLLPDPSAALGAVKAEAWDEVVEAVAWCISHGASNPQEALTYAGKHNPHRIEGGEDRG